MQESLLVIAPLPALSIRTRLNKLARMANSKGKSVSHWGWSRVAGDTAENHSLNICDKRMLLSTRTSSVRPFYPVWTLVVFLNLLVRRRPDVVYCLGLETAIGAWLASFFRTTQFVFDDADRLLLIVKLPDPLRRIVRWVEIRVSAKSVAHIVPGTERYDYLSMKFLVIRNTPTLVDLEAARTEIIPLKPSKFVVYVNGWLGDTRGLPPLLSASKALQNQPEISFVAAGRLDGRPSRSFVEQPNVNYLGEVSGAMSLAIYSISDVVVTLYDPCIEINCFAESNKWGDAIATRTPIIVNKEVKTASFLLEAGCAVSVTYGNPEELASTIESLATTPQKLAEMSKRLGGLSKELLHFDSAMGDLLEGLLK